MVLQVSDKSFLHSLFDKAEKQKSAFNIPEIEEQRREICENFAMDVFFNADNEDRSGNFTQETAKAFYAASLFFDVLEQFGPDLDPEITEKRKYAKWRSIELMNARKEGRAPTPAASLVSLALLKTTIFTFAVG